MRPGVIAAGASVPFVPNGISMHREFGLQYAAGALTASAHGVMSVWLRGSAGSSAHLGMTDNMTMNNKVVVGNYQTGFSAETTPGMNFSLDNSGAPEGMWRLNLNDATGGTNHSTLASYGPPAITNAKWDHWFWAYATDFALGLKRSALYRNGVKVLGGTSEVGTIGSFSVALGATHGWWINGSDTDLQSGVFDIAQLFFDTPADMSGILDSSNNVNASVLSKFYNSGAVDFGPTGSLPLGAQPIIFHDGDKTTWATNKGTLASPTAVGGNANTMKPFNAPINPTEVPDRPYQNWFAWDSSGFTQSTGTNTTISNFGNPIAQGDLLLMIVKFTLNANFDHDPVVTGVNTGWTRVLNSKVASSQMNFVMYYKIADANDVTAAGQEWNSTGGTYRPVINWTTDASSFYGATYQLFCYKNVSGISSSSAGLHAAATSATGFVCPSVTAPAGKSLLVCGAAVFDWAFEGNVGSPASQNLRFKRKDQSSGMSAIVSDEKIDTSGLTGTRTFSTTATGNPYASFSIILQ